MRAGIIGLDTSHATALIHAPNVGKPPQAGGMTVVAAYLPKGQPGH